MLNKIICNDCNKEYVYQTQYKPNLKKTFCKDCSYKHNRQRANEFYQFEKQIKLEQDNIRIKDNEILDMKKVFCWDEVSVLI